MNHLTPYEAGWAKTLEELRNAPAFRMHKHLQGEIDLITGDAHAAFEQLAEWEHITLDPALQSHYLRFSRLSAAWETIAPHPNLAGEFNLHHLYEALCKNPPEHLITSHDTEEQRRLISELHVFDDTPTSGVGSFAALRTQPGANNPEVWLFQISQSPMKLDIDYREYLDVLQVTKGTFGWQYLFTETSLKSEEFEFTVYRLKTMLQVFPEIFPDHDYAPLKERLAERIR
ncbi:hypothetical protein [Streptomyces sclerotialus]|uniref:hypothetical protein n=1 Tax=Streptomyces sclerotialus TaxID=1957 RepID=UPI0004CA3ED3